MVENKERDEEIEIIVIDKVEEDLLSDIKSEFGIKNVPTTIFFKEGVEVDRKIGGYCETEFVSLIENNLK